jgi:hypothetical protein
METLDIWKEYGFTDTAASTWQQLKDRLLWLERNGLL